MLSEPGYHLPRTATMPAPSRPRMSHPHSHSNLHRKATISRGLLRKSMHAPSVMYGISEGSRLPRQPPGCFITNTVGKLTVAICDQGNKMLHPHSNQHRKATISRGLLRKSMHTPSGMYGISVGSRLPRQPPGLFPQARPLRSAELHGARPVALYARTLHINQGHRWLTPL